MQFTDQGIILSVRKFSEQGALVRVLTFERGMCAGIDKFALTSRRRGTYQPGNRVEIKWQARLSEHLGTLTTELVDPTAASLLDDATRLSALHSACQLASDILPEREPEPEFYAEFCEFLELLTGGHSWHDAYVHLELKLLKLAGFGLDLESCAATGLIENLHYVSPKSGRAVSRDAGRPYHGKLFLLPAFLRQKAQKSAISVDEILDGLTLCGYFLEQRVFQGRAANLPVSRKFLQSRLTQQVVNNKEKQSRGEIIEILEQQ